MRWSGVSVQGRAYCSPGEQVPTALGADGCAPRAGRAVPQMAPTETSRAAPAVAERGYAGAGDAGAGSALPTLCSTRTGPLSCCPAGFGTAGVQARRAGLASAGC